MEPYSNNLKILEEIEMRALLRDAQDQTHIALEVEEAVYDPKDNKLFPLHHQRDLLCGFKGCESQYRFDY